MNQPSLPSRRTARVVIADEGGDLFLFRGPGLIDQGRHYFFAVGGGVDADETTIEAALRELREETGQTVEPGRLGGPIARTAGVWTTHDGVDFHSDDTFFFLRTARFAPDLSGMEEEERLEIAEGRWSSLADLRESEYPLFPRGLLPVVEDALDGTFPPRPVELESPSTVGPFDE
ncbi:NUDIX hydrolase [Salininema proteolyticum]|uniref:NUDIX hydrolase n=1 Tax=Salininema proteolyticum TaxID=1607685 RepID=A0ABV8TTZ9_9ACTN